MAQIKINPEQVQSINSAIRNNVNSIESIKQKINSQRMNLDNGILSSSNINQRLINTHSGLNNIQSKLNEIYQTTNSSAYNYETAEEKLKNNKLVNVANKNPSWFENFIKANFKFIDKTTDYASKILTILSQQLRLPTFKFDGKYLKILNNADYDGGNGYARWYTIENILSDKYPNATEAFKWFADLKITSTVLTVVSSGIVFFEEFYKNKTLPLERRISNGAVEVGITLAAGKVGAVIGTAVCPGVGTAVGIAAFVVGTVAGIAINSALDHKIWDGGKESTKDVIKDAVGSAVTATTHFVGDCAKGTGKFINGLFAPKFITGAQQLKIA